MTRKRIAVLTMTSEPFLMLAGVEDGQVHIIKCEQLSSSIISLKLTLPAKLAKLKAAGFVLLVDEVLPTFAKYGRAVRLSHMDANNRPIVVSAMEAYRYLTALGGITYPQNAVGQFEISDSLINEQRDGSGKLAYSIDWHELQPETYALLLAIYAGTQDSVADNATMKALLERLNSHRKVDHSNRARNLFDVREKWINGGGKHD